MIYHKSRFIGKLNDRAVLSYWGPEHFQLSRAQDYISLINLLDSYFLY